MSENEQYEAIRKSADTQTKTLKRWIGNLTKDEGLIFVRTYKGKPGLVVGQIIMEDLLGVMDHLLSGIAKDVGIEFGELLTNLAMLHYARNDNSNSSKSDKEN